MKIIHFLRALWTVNILLAFYDFTFFFETSQRSGIIAPSDINMVLGYILVGTTLTIFISSMFAIAGKGTSAAVTAMRPAVCLLALANFALNLEAISIIVDSGDDSSRFVLQYLAWAIWLCLNIAVPGRLSSRAVNRSTKPSQ